MVEHRPMTHAHEGPVVVFNIGMTIRRPLRPDLWGPAIAAMPRMLAELGRAKAAAERGEGPDLGFLGATTLMGASGPWVTQYWSDVDKLYAYAASTDHAHLPAWRDFNRRARSAPGAVGIWHETFVVHDGGIESIYGQGARTGLGAAAGVIPLEKRGLRAAQRLGTRASA